MADRPDNKEPAAAFDLVRRMIPFWTAELGDRLLGVYVIGSLAHGGYGPRYSDIDYAVVAEEWPAPPPLDNMRAAATALDAVMGTKLSLFWTDRSFNIGRFPPLDRLDYLDFGIAVFEREHVIPPRPSLQEVQSYLGGAPFANWVNAARRFAAMERLEPKDHKAYLRAHLYPARFIYSFMTGRMASNDAALDYLRRQPPPGLDLDLVTQALECRNASQDPDALFPRRDALPHQVAACARTAGLRVPRD